MAGRHTSEANPRVVVLARLLGERRNEIVFTGMDLDERAIRLALDEVLLTDHELAQGRDEWAAVLDPLLG